MDCAKWLSTFCALVMAIAAVISILPGPDPPQMASIQQNEPKNVVLAKAIFSDNGSTYIIDYNNNVLKLNDSFELKLLG